MTIAEPMATPPTFEDINHLISSKPDVCGGKPCIDGHRIRVEDVAVWCEDQNWSVAAILNQFPQLTPAKVYAALAYYYQNKAAIRAQMEASEEAVASMKAAAAPTRYQRVKAMIEAGKATMDDVRSGQVDVTCIEFI